MNAKKEATELGAEVSPDEPKTPNTKDIDKFGAQMYIESARALRQVGARVILSVGAAILVWIFGMLVFLPIAEGMTDEFMGYPIHAIVSFVIVVALAVIIFAIFVDIRRLTGAAAGLMAYHFGKASGETHVESYKNYRTALDGIIYIVVMVLAFLLFASFLAEIHPAIPAILLILIVIWAIFSLWRSMTAVAAEIARRTAKLADALEEKAKGE
jgi:hypothetical protein